MNMMRVFLGVALAWVPACEATGDLGHTPVDPEFTENPGLTDSESGLFVYDGTDFEGQLGYIVDGPQNRALIFAIACEWECGDHRFDAASFASGLEHYTVQPPPETFANAIAAHPFLLEGLTNASGLTTLYNGFHTAFSTWNYGFAVLLVEASEDQLSVEHTLMATEGSIWLGSVIDMGGRFGVETFEEADLTFREVDGLPGGGGTASVVADGRVVHLEGLGFRVTQ